MGFIAQLAKGRKDVAFPGMDGGRRLWDRTFGRTKEGDESNFPVVRPTLGASGGGSFGRSITSSTAATIRLIQAMRSMAPGGWSDDRWTESKKWTDVRYLAGHRIGEQMLQAEVEVFHQVGPGKDDKKPVHPDDPPQGGRLHSPYDLVKLLKHPNNDDTFGELMYATHQQMMLTGMALTWMLPNEGGVPMQLFPIPTALAIPQPAINPDYPDGFYRIQPVYPYGPFSSYPTPSTSVGAPIDARWILRIKYTHPFLRYDGWSPQTALNMEFDTVQQMAESRWNALKKVIDPSAVLSTQSTGEAAEGTAGFPEAEIERMLAEIENEKQGTSNVGKLFIPPPGWKLEPWMNNLRDLQYTEGWEQMVSFLMAALGISKEAAGMIGSTAYAQLFAALKQLHWLTLDPLCYRIAQKFTMHLGHFFGDNLVIEIKPKKIDDHEVIFNKINAAQTAVAIKKGEVRKLLDLPLTGEEWEEDMAGDPSPKQEQQMQEEQQAAQQQQQQEGDMAKEQAAKDGELQDKQTQLEGAKEGLEWVDDKNSVDKERPKTGSLNAGSLGPKMKSLRVKSSDLRSKYKRVTTNGRH
jgi:phage portal protein BeeE